MGLIFLGSANIEKKISQIGYSRCPGPELPGTLRWTLFEHELRSKRCLANTPHHGKIREEDHTLEWEAIGSPGVPPFRWVKKPPAIVSSARESSHECC
jgi:hypothetical protein